MGVSASKTEMRASYLVALSTLARSGGSHRWASGTNGRPMTSSITERTNNARCAGSRLGEMESARDSSRASTRLRGGARTGRSR